jgi:tetratricopeptide (TPR) repeat protein
VAAEERERALPYALLAGDQAAAVYAHAEAEQHYRSAIALAAELGDRAHEAETLAKLTTTFEITTRFEDAIAAGERAVRLWQTLQDREGVAAATLVLVRAYWSSGRYEDVQRHQGDLILYLTSDEPPDPPERSVADLLASARAERAAVGLSPDTATFLCTARAVYLSGQNRFDDALAAIEQALPYARRASDTQLICQAHMIHGGMVWNLGRVQAALDAHLHTAQLTREAGDFWNLSITLSNAAEGYVIQGEIAQAERIGEEALVAAERAGAPSYLAGAFMAVAQLAFITGAWPRACAPGPGA